MEEKNTLVSSSIKYGLILGLISIVVSFILYAMGPEVMLGPVAFVNLAISIGLTVYFGIRVRKEIGGIMPFKQAFTSVFLISIVSIAMAIIFTALLYNVIDPELASTTANIQRENTEKMLRNFGSDEATIDQTISGIQAENFEMNAKNLSIQLLTQLIGAAIFALIIGAIIKKNPPEEFYE